MKLDLFIKEYKKAADKDKFLKSHIVNTYVNYERKTALCENIVNASMYTTENNQKHFRQNSPVKNELTLLSLVTEYTDIEIGDTGEEMLAAFNELNKEGVFGGIISNIPETEYVEFTTLLDMVTDDFLANERDLISYIETKARLIVESLGGIDGLMNMIKIPMENK